MQCMQCVVLCGVCDECLCVFVCVCPGGMCALFVFTYS